MFKKKGTSQITTGKFGFILLVTGLFLILSLTLSIAAPTGADDITVWANETKAVAAGYMINVSGGYITTFNITATTQNSRWKGMVGHVTGSFTLDDASGSSLFDWSIASVAGEIFATRNSTTPIWTSIKCANRSLLETENILMNHSSPSDNLTATFNTTNGATHTSFTIGAATISANTCPTLNTYVNNATQDTRFEEVALTDSTNFTAGGNIIYSTVIEQDRTGFDSGTYDFQMIVPENGLATFTGSTAYYLYVELS